MRRKARREEKGDISKKIIYIIGGILIVSIITFSIIFSMYTSKLKELNNINLASQINDLVPNENEEIESASNEIGKSVEESQNDLEIEEEANQISKEDNTDNSVKETNVKEEKNETKNETKKENIKPTQTAKETAKPTITPKKTEEPSEKLEFEKPVNGEIITGFANESLVYSKTLQEWVTHNGIDIKADKTTVVKAVEKGVVKAIKNDPRYGITIIIEHSEGYTSCYSNLLTSEFVVEGEQVEKGQTIGTVGNSSSFEIAEESHLHFEMLKDGKYIDPILVINF